DPRDVVLPHGFDDERVAFPVADRVAEPRLFDLRVVRTAVQPDVTPDVRAAFVDDNEFLRGLDEAPRIWRRAHARDAWRQAARLGIFAAERGLALVVDRLRLRQHRDFDAGANHVHVLADGVRLPVARQIGMAVSSARDRPG